MAALLSHEGIADVYDYGVHDSRPYTIFEYVSGQDLRKVMESRGQWSVDDVLTIIRPLADALDYAHAEGVIHSDLKPENICLTPSGQPKILDFGIAQNLKTETGKSTFRGTAGYASPEQAACRPTDGRSDQYALGLIAFELLAGRRPFLGDNPLSQLYAHEYEPPPLLTDIRDGLPKEAASSVMRTLEKEPSKRFGTCREFVSAFAAYARDKTEQQPTLANTEIHISETSSESLIARRLADAFESQGYVTWYYQRDALPGIPLGRQVYESLQSTRAAVLLISRSALSSHDFAEEVMSAQRLGRTCLPILIDMSLEEFDSHQPIWRPALGTAVAIELDRDDINKTLVRIQAAITQLGIKPRNARASSSQLQRSTSAQIWATDANQIDIEQLSEIVFRNEVIDEFLTRRNRYFISATKGLGKTLLLTFKRHLLTQSHGEAGESVCWIPTGRPYLDFMAEMKLLSARYEKPLCGTVDLQTVLGSRTKHLGPLPITRGLHRATRNLNCDRSLNEFSVGCGEQTLNHPLCLKN